MTTATRDQRHQQQVEPQHRPALHAGKPGVEDHQLEFLVAAARPAAGRPRATPAIRYTSCGDACRRSCRGCTNRARPCCRRWYRFWIMPAQHDAGAEEHAQHDADGGVFLDARPAPQGRRRSARPGCRCTSAPSSMAGRLRLAQQAGTPGTTPGKRGMRPGASPSQRPAGRSTAKLPTSPALGARAAPDAEPARSAVL